MSPEGKPIQVNTSALQAAAAQNAMGRLYVFKLNINWSKPWIVISLKGDIEIQVVNITIYLGNTVTVMSPEGKPIQVNTSALQAAAAQTAMGRLFIFDANYW